MLLFLLAIPVVYGAISSWSWLKSLFIGLPASTSASLQSSLQMQPEKRSSDTSQSTPFPFLSHSSGSHCTRNELTPQSQPPGPRTTWLPPTHPISSHMERTARLSLCPRHASLLLSLKQEELPLTWGSPPRTLPHPQTPTPTSSIPNCY